MAIIDREFLIRKIKEFTQLPEDIVKANMKDGYLLLAKEWMEVKPQTEEDVKRWYRETPFYIWDLAQWNAGADYVEATIIPRGYNHGKHNVKILDFGCGIGTLVYYMSRDNPDNELWALDLPSKTLKFAKFLNEDNGNIHFTTDLNEVPNELDCIVSIDVLEHLPFIKPVLDSLIPKLNKKKGRLILHYHKKVKPNNPVHPMHITNTEFVPEYLTLKGFEKRQEHGGTEEWHAIRK